MTHVLKTARVDLDWLLFKPKDLSVTKGNWTLYRTIGLVVAFFWANVRPSQVCSWFFGAFLAFWASCGWSVWLVRQQGSEALFFKPTTRFKSFRRSKSAVTTRLSMIHWSAVMSRVSARTKSSTRPQTGISTRLMGFRQRVWSMLHLEAHGDSLTDTRTEKASEIENSALKLGSSVVVLTAGRDVYEERLFEWTIFGDKLITASPDSWYWEMSLGSNHIRNHIHGRRNKLTSSSSQSVMTTSVTGYDRERRLLLLSPVAKIFLTPSISLIPHLTGSVGLQDGFLRAASRRIVGNHICSDRCFISAVCHRACWCAQPCLDVNVGFSLNCNIPLAVLLAIERPVPRCCAGMLWMWLRV